MTRRRSLLSSAHPPRSAALLVAAAAAAALCGCEEEPSQRPERDVQELVLPTEAEIQADKLRHEAETFLSAGKPQLAEAPLRRVLELSPKDSRSAEILAECLVRRDRHAEAVPVLRAGIAAAPKRPGLYAALVRALFATENFAEAAKAAAVWADLDGSNADAWFDLGRARYRLGELDGAILAFRRAETLKAARADIRSELGLALAASGQLPRAEAKQRDALDREPEYAEAWFRLGDVIFRRDPARAQEAADALGKAVEFEPGHVLAHLYLFRVCRLADASAAHPLRERGETAWQAVLRIHGRAQLASILGADAQRDEATSEFVLEEKVAQAPADPEPRLALARFLHAERRWDEAIVAYRRALECGAPAGPTRVRLAAALVSSGDAAAAETELRTGFDRAAAAPVHRLLAWILLVQGKDADAVEAADSALALAADDVLAKKVRALARMHSGTDAAALDAAMNEIASLGWL